MWDDELETNKIIGYELTQVSCINCEELPNESGYCNACELLILEGTI
jgi:hypothetical protein